MTAENDAASHASEAENSAQRREEKKQVSRRKILEAAKEVFFRDGFMAANLDEVAQKAGVAKGTLYRYFDSKAELYVAVLGDNSEIFSQRMRETVAGDSSASDRVRRVAKFYFDHWVRNHDYFQIFWAIENQAVIGELPPGVLDEIASLWEECVTVVSDIVDDGVRGGEFAACDPWEMANFLWTVANGLIQSDSSSTRRSLRRVPLEKAFTDAVEICLRGMAA